MKGKANKKARPAGKTGPGQRRKQAGRPGGAARPGAAVSRPGPESFARDAAAGRPEILAPAGDMQAALAALAAGADALYLGLKHFSARMQADNFSTGELAALTELAHEKGRRVYVAMNTLVKPSEPARAYRLIRRLADDVRPDALILQDPGLPGLARQAGFSGELHLSTLANITHQKALMAARAMGADRVIIPRELSFEEVRLLGEACPDDLALEMFVHGALCYCVSGRCWWSSYMGGKSGLRGRCVQPCRRLYTQKGREGRFFSCMDLALGPAVRALLELPFITSWKIEGRKKGPHYVYNVTSAYRLMRDEPDNPEALREAGRLLGMALGRPGTRVRFSAGLAGGQEESPTSTPSSGEQQTSSGLLCGRISRDEEGRFSIRPRLDLLARDFLRVGYEDELWHCTLSLPGPAAEGEPLVLRLPGNKRPKPGTPVFLIDRRDPGLTALLEDWNRELRRFAGKQRKKADVAGEEPRLPGPPRQSGAAGKRRLLDIRLLGSLPHGREGKEGVKPGTVQGLWLSPKAIREISRTLYGRISWWLPPVIWPDEEALWQRLIISALRGGARHFVCNAPWQTALFKNTQELSLTAGPFCNLANAAALEAMRGMGFEAAVISPELGAEDILALPGMSPLPLGIVLSGFWPVGITRHRSGPVKAQDGFQSPKGEGFWMRRHGENLWFYPAWPLDLTEHRPALERAGYTTFIHMEDHPPRQLEQAKRPGEFNWNIDVL